MAVNRIVGTTLHLEREDDQVDLMEARGYEDDGGIPFTAYNVKLGIRPLNRGMSVVGFDAMLESFARYLGARLALALSCQTMVVRGLQHLVATFTPETAVVRDDR